MCIIYIGKSLPKHIDHVRRQFRAHCPRTPARFSILTFKADIFLTRNRKP